jgi:hypothetical protein
MVTLEQYRASIGVFSGKRSVGLQIKCAKKKTMYLTVFVLTLLLILAGDVETNPGPSTNQQILAKLDNLKRILTRTEIRNQIAVDTKKQVLRSVSKTLNLLKRKETPLKFQKDTLHKLQKLRMLKIAHSTFHPDLQKLSDGPMEKEHKLYKDQDIKVYIKRVKFAKQKNFAMQDHQYQVKIKQSDNESPAPLFKDVIDSMHLALSKVVKELQQQLDPKKHSQIYFCFIHPDLAANIFTGNYTLHSDNSDKITDEVFQRLASTLRSFQFIALDSSFEIKIKVLSVEHVAHKIKEGKMRWKNMVGIKKDQSYYNILSNKTVKSLITIPSDDCFRSKCLPAAVLLGYYYSRHARHKYNKACGAKNDAKIYDQIKRFNQTRHKVKREDHAGRAIPKLLQLIHELTSKLGFTEPVVDGYEMTDLPKGQISCFFKSRKQTDFYLP